MLKKHIGNKVYVGIPFEECPLSLEAVSELTDKYYMKTRSDRLFIFLNETLLKNLNTGFHVVSYGHPKPVPVPVRVGK